DLVLLLADEVQIELGRRNGDFTRTNRPRIEGSFAAAEIADFNVDGYPDLVLAGAEGVRLFRGSYDGLNGSSVLTTMDAVEDLALLDYDGDCKDELIALGGGRLTVLLRGMDGKFVPDFSTDAESSNTVTIANVVGGTLPDFLAISHQSTEIIVGDNVSTEKD